ncbi:TIGR02270 family protein [Myxococcus xanthus]|uniref:TIGR02270 family protein n=1 Tax=Myxococcus xanthus TaxID=34 RepID=UPI001916F7ED|nr:TIGR02270 family protein [Myxococcus xanthus]QQR45260.1 TIGR02270 family protein [Myxococcus xanthus]
MMLDVLEEHLSEAAFLWAQWERANVAANYTLDEAAELETRLLAHLDGLVTAGTSATAFLAPKVQESEDPGEAFSAAWALLSLAPSFVLEAMKARATDAPFAVQFAMTRALELGEAAVVEPALAPWLNTAESIPLSLALNALGFRGRISVDRALQLLGHPDGVVVAAALRALRPSPKHHAPKELGRLLVDSRPVVRWAAIMAGLLFGLRDAWDACEQDAITAQGAPRRTAWGLLAAAGDARFLARLLASAESESSREDALWALGFSGRIPAAESCMRWMEGTPRVARLAGEAFSAITGLRLEGAYALAEPEPEDALPPLEEESLDADLSLRAEDALPLPAAEEIGRWWATGQTAFHTDARYLEGRGFTGLALLDALEHGPMRRRQMHALELMLRTRGACTVQVQAFSWRQREELLLAAAVRERLPAWGVGR